MMGERLRVGGLGLLFQRKNLLSTEFLAKPFQGQLMHLSF